MTLKPSKTSPKDPFPMSEEELQRRMKNARHISREELLRRLKAAKNQ